jgi:hypothetical protein
LKIKSAILVLSLLTSLSAATAHAGLILQDQQNGTSQILSASPVGQTFTAEDAQIASIGVWVTDSNAFIAPNDYDLQMTLRTGAGAGAGTGAVVGTSLNDTLTDGFSGWLDFDFSHVSLTVADLYNFQISYDTARCAVGRNQHSFSNGV